MTTASILRGFAGTAPIGGNVDVTGDLRKAFDTGDHELAEWSLAKAIEAGGGDGNAAIDSAIRAAIKAGRTVKDYHAVATDLVGAAIKFRDEPEMKALIALGQSASGGKGWMHEIPDIVKQRWAAATS